MSKLLTNLHYIMNAPRSHSKFSMHNFSSIFTVLPNGDNDNEAVLKESQNNFDRPIEKVVKKSL